MWKLWKSDSLISRVCCFSLFLSCFIFMFSSLCSKDQLWGGNLKSSQVFSKPLPFPCMVIFSSSSCMCSCFWMPSALVSISQKGEKKRNKVRREGSGHLGPLEITSAWGEQLKLGEIQQLPTSFASLWSQSVINNYSTISDISSRVFCLPLLPQAVSSCCNNVCIVACCEAEAKGWVVTTVPYFKLTG